MAAQIRKTIQDSCCATTNYMNWPWKKKTETPPIRVQLVSSSTLTLDQWRKDTRLVSAAKELARNETFRMMIAVLENSHLRFGGFAATGVSQEDRAAKQARDEGYQICLNNLDAMTKPSTVNRMPRETWQTPTAQPKP